MRPFATPNCSLGDAGGVGVVDEQDVAAESLLEELLGFEADPLLRDVRRRHRATAEDDGGKAHADRHLARAVPEPVDHRGHLGDDRVGLAAGRGRYLEPLAHEFAGGDIHEGALDAGAADVDPDREVRRRSHS